MTIALRGAGRGSLGPRDALVVLDVQNDFLPGGALAVPRADALVPVLAAYVRRAIENGVHVFASRDWHPPHHASFREQGGPWPRHCVSGTSGAEIAPALRLPPDTIVISKGTDPECDAYSAFEGTELDAALRALGVTRLLVGGLATDYCVLHTVRDARARGYHVMLLDDGTRGFDPVASAAARQEMVSLGAVPVTLTGLRRTCAAL